MKRKILIMTASTGGGHNRAARAIEEELLNISNDKLELDVKIVDSFRFINTFVDKLISGSYETSAKYSPSTYGRIYHISDTRAMSKKEHKNNPLTKFLAVKYKKLIRSEMPDLIIGTHSFPMVALSLLKLDNLGHFPKLMTVFTDYTAHSAWIQSEVDYYVVGDAYVKELIIDEGISENSIHTLGIPIEKSFLESRPRADVLSELGLDPNEFIILLMGGSFGAGNISESLDELISIDRDFQVLVITGRNSTLKNKLEEKIQYVITDKNVRILGFVNNMNDILSSCDILITKPGGLTTTEALIKEIPMVIPYFIPGQEEENLDFFTNCGAAVRATKKFSLSVIIKVLMDNPERIELLRENIRTIKKTDCAKKIAELSYEILGGDEIK